MTAWDGRVYAGRERAWRRPPNPPTRTMSPAFRCAMFASTIALHRKAHTNYWFQFRRMVAGRYAWHPSVRRNFKAMEKERDRLIAVADKLIQEDKRLPMDLIARLIEMGVDLTTLAGEQDHG